MRYTLLYILCLTTLNIQAQPFAFPEAKTHIYPIPAHLIDAIINYELKTEDLPKLPQPYPEDFPKEKLPFGHYLTATLSGEKVNYRYFHTYNYEVEIDAADGKFQLRLHDPEGKERADAKVTADGKPVRYNKKHRAYRKRDWRIDDLKIIVDNDTLFYHVNEDIRRSRFAHDVQVIGARQPFQILKRPYYYGQSIYKVFKDGIGRDYWHWPRYYPLQNTIRRIVHPGAVNGYVTTSQPRYQPGDSLRVSAYLAYPKGRPVGVDSIDMTIRSYGRGTTKYFNVRVGGSAKGRYTHVMAIPPDWPLDQDYNVTFSLPGLRWRNVAPNISFKFQDYELAEYELTTEISDDARLPGSAWLDVKTEDINGLPLPNGNIKITVHLESFLASRDSNTVVLPDTLYSHTEQTDNRIDRRIILPDSLFPKGHSVRIKVETQLTGPSGEYKEETNTLTVDRRYPFIPKIEVRGDSLLTFLAPAAAPKNTSPDATPPMQEIKNREPRIENRESVTRETPVTPATSPLSPGEGPGERAYATLQTITQKNDTLSQIISLPHTQILDHQQSKYRLLYDEQEVSKEMVDLKPVSGTPAYWSRDTLLLQFPNPNAQPLRWTLYKDGQLLAKGNQDSTAFIRSGFAPGTKLNLHYAYLAAGKWRHDQSNVSAPRYDQLTEHKKVLDLQLTQPAKVTPGETVRIALTATDQKGRPAANVRLTAGTYNARFDKTPMTAPTYNKRNKRRRSIQNYHRDDYSLNHSEVPPSWLIKDYGLDTALAYQLRYPDGEFTFQRDLDTILPEQVQHAHFAPFVIKGHQPVTIRTVYADDRLVYWWHPNIRTPYSIPVDSGWHKISLRTDKHLYTKSIYFESCRQLVLSFDAERWVRAGWTRQSATKSGQKWNDGAVERIWERVFALSHMRTSGFVHFRTGDDDIIQSAYGVGNSSWAPVGLAANNDQLRFWFPNHDSVGLRFEPRATYRITRARDRLYPLKKGDIVSFMERSAGSGPAAPGVPEYSYEVPVEKPQPRYISHAKRLPRLVPLEPVARVQYANLHPKIKRVIIAPVETDDLYYTDLDIPNHVKPGIYDVLYHFHNDSVFHQLVEFGENSLTLLAFRREDVRHFNSFSRFQGYSLSKPPKKVKASFSDYDFSGKSISGIVKDKTGTALPFATVYVAGSSSGTTTDLDGEFSLEVPDLDFFLLVNYTGYQPQTIEFLKGENILEPLVILMDDTGVSLMEVVITGYRVPLMEQDNTTSAQTISSEEIRNLPNRDIRQIAAMAAGASITDEGGTISIRGSRSNAVEYYVDGVRVNSTDIPDSELAQVPGWTTRIRGVSSINPEEVKYFINDVEYTGDLLLIDERSITRIEVKNGAVYLTTLEDNLNSIAANLPPANLRESFSDYAAYIPDIRTDKQGKAVFDITFPDDITAWNTFAVGQDRRRRIGFALERTNAFLPLQAQLYLPRFLVEGDRAEAATLAINREGGERSVRLSFQGKDDEAAQTQDAKLVDALEDRYPIEATVGADSMTYQFTVQATDGDQASDGERRTLPVYPKGTEMVSGELLLLTGETSALPDEFIRPERGPVTLRLPGNRVQQLLNDLDHIVDYPYACTEQTASRLIGLLQMNAIREAEGKVFERAGEITKMVLRLEKLRRADGGFGWWASSTSSTPWISLHVYRALSAAEKAGHTVSNLYAVRRYLLGRLPELPVRDQLQVLLTLGEEGNPPTAEEMVRIDTFSAPNDYELLAVTRLRQLRGDTVDVQRLLDSSSTHAALGRYWGRRGYYFSRQPLDGRLACGLLAHQILSTAGRAQEAGKALNYLLGQSAARNRPGNVPLLGTNTLESARLLAELLPALLDEDGALSPPAVTLRADGATTQVTVFPFEVEVPTDAVPGLRLERAGSGPLPVSLYQRWFETKPVAQDDGFQLTSRITDKRGRPLETLKQGETAYLVVTVVNTSDADYVLVEIPIPAGCSYQNRDETRGSRAVHREYRRDRVAVFCDRLPAGSHTYKVALAPRFSGTYTLNPARAEMQYLQVVNGNDRLTTVVVE